MSNHRFARDKVIVTILAIIFLCLCTGIVLLLTRFPFSSNGKEELQKPPRHLDVIAVTKDINPVYVKTYGTVQAERAVTLQQHGKFSVPGYRQSGNRCSD